MHKSLLTTLTLIACCAASAASAQSSNYGDYSSGGQTPTLIMPDVLTNPISNGLGADGYGANAVPTETGASDAADDVPYSVPGEEQLEPDTN
jgi:hypothetical protein